MIRFGETLITVGIIAFVRLLPRMRPFVGGQMMTATELGHTTTPIARVRTFV
jgi:hypothetical protein